MSELKSITVLFDDRKGCEGWYARAVESIDGGIQRYARSTKEETTNTSPFTQGRSRTIR